MKANKATTLSFQGLAIAFVLTVILSGCGRQQTLGPVTPLVVSTVPANGAAGVPMAQMISATFNEAMNPATIDTSTVTVTGPGGAPVTGTVTFSGKTATFAPTASLAPGTLYTGTITTGAANPTGTGLASNFVWTFTTGTIPTVVATVPLNGATNVALNQKIVAIFSQAMNSATVVAPGGVRARGDRRCSGAGNGDLCGSDQHSDVFADSEFAAQHPIHSHHKHVGAKCDWKRPRKQLCLEFWNWFDHERDVAKSGRH